MFNYHLTPFRDRGRPRGPLPAFRAPENGGIAPPAPSRDLLEISEDRSEAESAAREIARWSRSPEHYGELEKGYLELATSGKSYYYSNGSAFKHWQSQLGGSPEGLRKLVTLREAGYYVESRRTQAEVDSLLAVHQANEETEYSGLKTREVEELLGQVRDEYAQDRAGAEHDLAIILKGRPYTNHGAMKRLSEFRQTFPEPAQKQVAGPLMAVLGDVSETREALEFMDQELNNEEEREAFKTIVASFHGVWSAKKWIQGFDLDRGSVKEQAQVLADVAESLYYLDDDFPRAFEATLALSPQERADFLHQLDSRKDLSEAQELFQLLKQPVEQTTYEQRRQDLTEVSSNFSRKGLRPRGDRVKAIYSILAAGPWKEKVEFAIRLGQAAGAAGGHPDPEDLEELFADPVKAQQIEQILGELKATGGSYDQPVKAASTIGERLEEHGDLMSLLRVSGETPRVDIALDDLELIQGPEREEKIERLGALRSAAPGEASLIRSMATRLFQAPPRERDRLQQDFLTVLDSKCRGYDLTRRQRRLAEFLPHWDELVPTGESREKSLETLVRLLDGGSGEEAFRVVGGMPAEGQDVAVRLYQGLASGGNGKEALATLKLLCKHAPGDLEEARSHLARLTQALPDRGNRNQVLDLALERVFQLKTPGQREARVEQLLGYREQLGEGLGDYPLFVGFGLLLDTPNEELASVGELVRSRLVGAQTEDEQLDAIRNWDYLFNSRVRTESRMKGFQLLEQLNPRLEFMRVEDALERLISLPDQAVDEVAVLLQASRSPRFDDIARVVTRLYAEGVSDADRPGLLKEFAARLQVLDTGHGQGAFWTAIKAAPEERDDVQAALVKALGSPEDEHRQKWFKEAFGSFGFSSKETPPAEGIGILGRLYESFPDQARSATNLICGLEADQRGPATEAFEHLATERKVETYRDLTLLLDQAPKELQRATEHLLLLDGALASSPERGEEARKALVRAYAQGQDAQARDVAVKALAAELVERGSWAQVEARAVEVNFQEDGLEVGGFLLSC